MKIKGQYTENEIKPCLSVIVELMTYLKKYREHIVLVGGWVPYFLYEELNSKEYRHVGSLDVDLALNFLLIPEQDYQTIADILEEQCYKNRKDRKGNIIPASYERSFFDKNGIKQTVQVDFLAPEYGGTVKSKRHQRVQEILARKGRGADLVFNNYVEREIQAHMPNGAFNEVTVKIANLVSIITMKGFAFDERASEKDAYDIYWLFKNHPLGEKEIIKEFLKIRHKKLVAQSLSLTKENFKKIDSLGPVAVANFLEPINNEEKEIIIRDAYEIINRILEQLKI